jgi:hypothetical protein
MLAALPSNGTPGLNSTAWSSAFINYDFGFRTYVVPVPEPSLAWFVVGAAGMMVVTRRVLTRHRGSDRWWPNCRRELSRAFVITIARQAGAGLAVSFPIGGVIFFLNSFSGLP